MTGLRDLLPLRRHRGAVFAWDERPFAHGDRPSLAVTYSIGGDPCVVGDSVWALQRAGLVAVGLNLLLGWSFAWLEFIKSRTSSANLP